MTFQKQITAKVNLDCKYQSTFTSVNSLILRWLCKVHSSTVVFAVQGHQLGLTLPEVLQAHPVHL